MDNAQLDLCLREGRVDGIGDALEPVHAADQNIIHTAILKLSEDAQPELGAFVLGEPHAQQLLVAFKIDAQGQVDRFVDHLLVLADFDHDAIQVDDGVNRIQRTRLPFHDPLHHSFCDFGDQGGRDVGVVHLLESGDDLPGGHTLGVEAQDLVVHRG